MKEVILGLSFQGRKSIMLWKAWQQALGAENWKVWFTSTSKKQRMKQKWSKDKKILKVYCLDVLLEDWGFHNLLSYSHAWEPNFQICKPVGTLLIQTITGNNPFWEKLTEITLIVFLAVMCYNTQYGIMLGESYRKGSFLPSKNHFIEYAKWKSRVLDRKKYEEYQIVVN